MRPALAIDFDGTVTKDDVFPTIGPENMWVVGRIGWSGLDMDDAETICKDGIHEIVGELIKAPATFVIKGLSSKFEIIFHTCRTGSAQKMMIDWLVNDACVSLYKGHDYYINNNPYCPEAHEKPFADVYLDNRGLTWHDDLHVEEAINNLMSRLPVHKYIPQTI